MKKHWKEKMRALIAEMAMEEIGSKEVDEIEKKVKELLLKAGVTYNKSSLDAFREGAELMFAADQFGGDKDFKMILLISLTAISKRNQDVMDAQVDASLKTNGIKQ